jgi:sterol desaturase/sphingolipid hydroxylase (fatty acid hydroxylase superfamily)
MIDWQSPRIATTLLVSAAFVGLSTVAIQRRGLRSWLASRSGSDWLVDALGLTLQGTLIPFLQTALVARVLLSIAPSWAGVLALPAWAAFLLCFVGVDYAYYWNHRLLHSKRFWPLHQVHHSARSMDAWVSSRNSLWTSFLIVYLWLNGALLVLSGQEGAILWAAGLSSALDLWRHSGIQCAPRFEAGFSSLLITPTDHAWHHSRDVHDINFGANLNLWDRLHGTFQKLSDPPERIGIPRPASTFKTLFWPYP